MNKDDSDNNPGNLGLNLRHVEEYIRSIFGEDAKVTGIGELGALPDDTADLKGFGYGSPFAVHFETDNEADEQSIVISSMKESSFGHDHISDRAQIMLWQHDTFNRLPRHARSVDVGYFTKNGGLKSVGDAEEFFISMEMVKGKEYYLDLERIRDGGASELDFRRCRALASYLAEIHGRRADAPHLYFRRVRDLVGHGECIMGLADSYPGGLDFISWDELCEIEQLCVEWRWRLKLRPERLSVVHGDFHPWNVMFHNDTDTGFTVLDRSRGEYGEPADDVTSMSMNYILYSLNRHGRLEGDFKELFELFYRTYLDETSDHELLHVVQPFYAFRGLVVASPIWYPNLDRSIRDKLFNFIFNTLKADEFNPADVNEYLLKGRK